ncbi:MAG: hypothetical protein HW388_854 [Dehalococcoidia bacterium]|nr:hypothetical protein [Dehalococcoidia bacterium]
MEECRGEGSHPVDGNPFAEGLGVFPRLGLAQTHTSRAVEHGQTRAATVECGCRAPPAFPLPGQEGGRQGDGRPDVSGFNTMIGATYGGRAIAVVAAIWGND